MATEQTAAAPSDIKTDATQVAASLPPSPLAGADSAKHEQAPPVAPNGKDAAPPAEVKTETPPAEAKVEPAKAADAPAEAKKESPAESGDVKPPETKVEAKKEGKAETAKPEGEIKDTQAEKPVTKPEVPKPEPTALPTYDKLTVPEGIKLDDARVAKFDEIVGKAELAAKTDPHAALTAFRQDAVNFHVEEIQRVAKAVADNQINVWNRLVEQRVNELKSNPELGGNRIETSLGNAKYVLEGLLPELTKDSQLKWTKDDAAYWIKIADAGGVSHDLRTAKLLNVIYHIFAEPEPVHGQPPNVGTQSRVAKAPGDRGWYTAVDSKPAA